MVRNQMLCIVTPRWPGQPAKVTMLETELNSIFELLGCVHFASIALIPALEPQSGGALPTLMLEIVVDEGIEPLTLLTLMVACGHSTLWALYDGHAAGLLPQDASTRQTWLREFLGHHLSIAKCAYVGARDRTVQQILREADLYRQAHARACRLTADQRMEADWLTRKLQSWALVRRNFDWAHRQAPQSFWPGGGLQRIARVAAAVLKLMLICLIAWAAWQTAGWLLPQDDLVAHGLRQVFVAALLFIVALAATVALAPPLHTHLRNTGRWLACQSARLADFRHRRVALEVQRAHQVHPAVRACEAQLAIEQRPSHVISVTDIRTPVFWHRFWLRLWLRVINGLGARIFAQGLLCKAAGIKFGHWHFVDGGRRLLFCSNYDGSFGGYLDEFITGAAWGVNLFWGHTRLSKRAPAADGHPSVDRPREFPPRRCLAMNGGCKHEQAFKAYARDSMLPHLYLFQAYHLTQSEIERNTRLRNALFSNRNAVNDDIVARALQS